MVRSSNSAHTFYVSEVSIFDGEFVCENGGHVFRLIAHHTRTEISALKRDRTEEAEIQTYKIKHDFAQQHILQRVKGPVVSLR